MAASIIRSRPLASVVPFISSPSRPPGSFNEKSSKKPESDPWASIFNDLPVSSEHTQADIRNKSKFKPGTYPSSNFFTSNLSKFPANKPGLHGKRSYTTSSVKDSGDKGENPSTREEDDSAWDHIFANIDEDIAMSQKHVPPERSPSKKSILTNAPVPEHRTAVRYPRRSPMTASEKNAFDSMFEMIFRATTQKKENFTTAAVHLPLENKERRNAGWSWLRHNLSRDMDVDASSTNDVGSQLESPSRASSDVLPLPYLPPDTYGKLRNLPKRTTELDRLLDEKKEEVVLCHSDLEVLEWAVRELFGESDPKKSPMTSRPSKNTPLPPALYAPLLTYLMQYFISPPRYNYHTALALFTYARTLSSTSYVFGCNTSAYNVYLQARWAVEKDSSEILAILQEMDVNGVNFDSDTQKLLKRIRRDIEEGLRNSDGFLDDSSNLSESGLDIFSALEKAEQLIKDRRRMRSSSTNDRSRVDPKQLEYT